MTGERIWIADLWISSAVAEKISKKHGITAREVRDAILMVPGLQASWDQHPERGERALVKTEIRDNPVLVVLYPRFRDAYGDAWDLGSVYSISQ